MAKKYLTLEEAARQLGMAPDELVRLRERSEIRGFADRGTWKFRSEDVDEFARSRDADSSPDVPIIDDTKTRKGAAGDSGMRKGSSSGRFNKTSDSDVRLLLDETLVPGSKESDPDVVLSPLGTGDSDVRLSDDVGGLVDSASDSDVKLISTSSEDVLPSDDASSDGSDSDVKLVSADSDSDVRLAKPEAKAPGSDSDVRLVGTEEMATHHSDSDVRLSAPGSSMDLVGSGTGLGSSGSHVKLGGTSSVNLSDSSSDESSVLLAQDSGIALDTGSGMKVGGGSSADSGITLQSLADSGISLEKADSGISLAGPMDSGIALDADSGIALESDTDSGIALSADSGIALDAGSGKKGGKPSKKKEEKKEKKPQRPDEREEKTFSAVSGSEEFDDESTQVEVNLMDGEDDSSYKLHDDENEKTNVVLFADDDEESEDEPVAPPTKSKKARVDDSFALEEQESGVEFAEAEDFSDDEDLEVAEDVLTEDEGDLDEIDVFEPAEEDFDSSVQSGESHAELAPVMAMRSQVAAETPWDGLTFGILAVSSVCLLLAGVMMYDLVRTEWYFDQNVVVGTSLIDLVRGLFPTT